MDREFYEMAKNILIEEKKEVTFKIDVKEILEENDRLNIILEADGELIKKIEIEGDEIC